MESFQNRFRKKRIHFFYLTKIYFKFQPENFLSLENSGTYPGIFVESENLIQKHQPVPHENYQTRTWFEKYNNVATIRRRRKM